jgi:SOS-response transcriptional repressor LexA
MKKLRANLTTLLEQQDLSVNELAKNTGVPQPVLHRLVKGKTTNPNILTLIPIAKFFSISISQLLGEDLLPLSESNEISAKITIKLPIIPWEDIHDWIIHRQTKKSDFILVTENVSRAAFALKIAELKSNIDDPIFHENSIIVIEPNIIPQDSDYVIVKNFSLRSSQPLLRQLLIDGNNKYLKPLNSLVETQKLRSNEQIIGVMLEIRHRYIDLSKRKISAESSS